MRRGSFGVMVHYIIAPQGTSDADRKKEFDRIVNGFDLGTFLKQFDSTGADWLFFTIGQNTGYYCSSNGFLDRELPGHTSKRDLVMEIAQSIKARGKHFIAYLPAEIMQQSDSIKRAFAWDQGNLSQFQKRYGAFIKEYSLKFGPVNDGWWIDGCWEKPERFGDWQDWMSAFRAGNPNSAIAVSPGPSEHPITPLQDYLAGETYQLPPPHMPASGFVDGVQWHALLPIDSTFILGKPNVYSDEVLFSWVLKCKDVGGAVTLNIPIDDNGVMLPKSVAQLSRLAVYSAAVLMTVSPKFPKP